MFLKEKQTNRQTAIRFLILTVIITILSTLFVYVASIFNIMSEKLAKPVGDLLLFLLSYSAQTKWVFHQYCFLENTTLLDYSFLGDSDFDIAIHNSFYLYYSGLYGNPSKNLEASITSGSYSLYYEYDLDEEGYPKKIYCTELDNGMPISSTESEEAFTASIEYWED